MTIHEIAELAGVSTATVSRVFSRYPGIREEVRTRVLETARLHGYHPRVAGKQKNVVIITPYNSIYPVQSCVDMLLQALTRTLPERDFRLEILPVNNLERLTSIQFCAAAAIGTEVSDFEGWEERFGVPLVIVDRAPDRIRPGIRYVRSDEEQGMRIALEHLYKRGARKIGCIIHGDPGTGNASIRREAVVKTLKRLDLPAGERLICFSGPGSERYVELIGKLLQNGIDALFCPGGNAGIVALYAFSLYGKRIPDDLSFIASEQTFFSRHAVPPQTTITQDYDAVAGAVADVIERWLDNRPVTDPVVIPYRILSRESCRDA